MTIAASCTAKVTKAVVVGTVVATGKAFVCTEVVVNALVELLGIDDLTTVLACVLLGDGVDIVANVEIIAVSASVDTLDFVMSVPCAIGVLSDVVFDTLIDRLASVSADVSAEVRANILEALKYVMSSP